jgi:hypothetical protein
MDFEPIFTGNDLKLIESLVYDPTLTPSYDLIKNCLVWEDERIDGLTPAGYESLCDLWIARSFLQRKLDFSAHRLAPDYFKSVWERALEQGFHWPGFNRLSLSKKDLAYYEKAMHGAANEV